MHARLSCQPTYSQPFPITVLNQLKGLIKPLRTRQRFYTGLLAVQMWTPNQLETERFGSKIGCGSLAGTLAQQRMDDSPAGWMIQKCCHFRIPQASHFGRVFSSY